jgi:uncharacterized protein YdhG (YjbR/CyaY superfamily)
MKSQVANVKTYIAEVPAQRRAAMKKLRMLCRQNLAGYEEGIEYGMPCYKRDGVIEMSFASQKQYIAIYVHKVGMVNYFRKRLSGANVGKCCIRFTKPDKMNFDVLEQLLRRTACR